MTKQNNEIITKRIDRAESSPLNALVRRTIKFRGKAIVGSKWVYGSLMSWAGNYQIWETQKSEKLRNYSIYSESVCQFTGLKDKKDEEIYEGDICKWNLGRIGYDIGIIKWLEVEYVFSYDGTDDDITSIPDENKLEVIGNIFDNPELLNS